MTRSVQPSPGAGDMEGPIARPRAIYSASPSTQTASPIGTKLDRCRHTERGQDEDDPRGDLACSADPHVMPSCGLESTTLAPGTFWVLRSLPRIAETDRVSPRERLRTAAYTLGVLTRDQIEARLRAVLAAQSDVTAAYLFGSVARGTAKRTSDVDVAVLLTVEPPRTVDGLRLGLEGEVERALGLSLQLVVLNRAPCDLIHRVLRDGILLLDRDPGTRIRFEVDARNRYFDLQPFLRRYRRLPSPA